MNGRTLVCVLAPVVFAAACAEPATEAAHEVVTATATTTVVHTTTLAAPPQPADYEGLAPTLFGVTMDGIVDTVPRQTGAAKTVALTFDGCGGPGGSGIDWEILAALREFRVPATFFVSESWIAANPDATRELAADPLFRLENHGTRHLPLAVNGQAAYGIHGTANPAEAMEEIEGNRKVLARYGVDSTWFRAGTAHYDDIAVRIASDMGTRIAGFSVNGDDGAHASAATVAARIVGAPDGAIVLAHFNHPGSGTAAGLREALTQLEGQDVRFVFLDGTGAGD